MGVRRADSSAAAIVKIVKRTQDAVRPTDAAATGGNNRGWMGWAEDKDTSLSTAGMTAGRRQRMLGERRGLRGARWGQECGDCC